MKENWISQEEYLINSMKIQLKFLKSNASNIWPQLLRRHQFKHVKIIFSKDLMPGVMLMLLVALLKLT